MYVESFLHSDITNGITTDTFTEEIALENLVEEDIINDKIYSIQEAKLLVEEDNKKNEADKMKLKI